MSSLTSPNDRNPKMKITPSSTKQLTEEEVKNALDGLVQSNVMRNYPRLERVYVDPPLINQTYSLHSFIPSKNAKPDKDGIYGMVKFRGAFQTKEEAFKRAEYLIRTADSYHKIYTGFVGRPFPITTESRFSQEKIDIDLKKKTQEIVSENIIEKKRAEQRQVEDIKQREENLITRQKENKDNDPFEQYITNQVKRAQLYWTYTETQKKMDDMKQIILRTRTSIKQAEQEHPKYLKQYKEKYMKARDLANIPDDDNSFVKFLGKDLEVGF